MPLPRTVAFALAILLVAGPLAAFPAQAQTVGQAPLFILPSKLYSVASDPWLGGLWLGSEIGVIFRHDSGTLTHLSPLRLPIPDHDVHEVLPTQDRVWMGTGLGPAVYEKSDGNVRPVTTADGAPLKAASRALWVDDRAVWVGTDAKGLFHVNPVTLVATPVPNPVNGSAFQHPVVGIASDERDVFISVTGYGLVQWRPETGESALHKVHLLTEQPLYFRIALTPTDVWVATTGGGAVQLHRPTNTLYEYAGHQTLNAQTVYGLAALGSEIWFTTNGGVSRYDTVQREWTNWGGDVTGQAFDVTAHGGQIYVASVLNKVFSFDRPRSAWVDRNWWPAPSVPPINALVECSASGASILFGTGGAGAERFNPAASTWTGIGGSMAARKGPLDITIWGFDVGATDTWIASHRGAALWTPANDTWFHLRTDDLAVGNIMSNPVRDLARTPEGAWFATSSFIPPITQGWNGWREGSLMRWDRATDNRTYYRDDDGLANNNVTQVELTPGKVWVGYLEGGMDVLDLGTSQVRHLVGDAADAVRDIQVHDGDVWAAARTGVWRIDPDTEQATLVPGTGHTGALSLLFDGDRLWVGTYDAGIYAIDLGTGARTDFRSGTPVDLRGSCLVRHGDVLYVGTGRMGLQRLHVPTGTWLPDMGPSTVYTPGSAPPEVPRIAMSSPTSAAAHEANATLGTAGTAHGPSGSVVEVRMANGAWRAANGRDAWQANLTTPVSAGPALVSARLRLGSQVLAQAGVEVTVEAAPGAPEPVDHGGVFHLPSAETEVGSTLRFVVTGRDVANATGTVAFAPPGGAATQQVPLALEGAALTAQSPRLASAGVARYTIRLQWADGAAATLPESTSGFGATYEVQVRPATVQVLLDVRDALCPAVRPGQTVSVSARVENHGNATATLHWRFLGDAAPWIEAPALKTLKAGEAKRFPFTLEVPEGTAQRNYRLEGGLVDGATVLDAFACMVSVDAGAKVQESDKGAPGPAWVLVAAALLGLAWRRR